MAAALCLFKASPKNRTFILWVYHGIVTVLYHTLREYMVLRYLSRKTGGLLPFSAIFPKLNETFVDI